MTVGVVVVVAAVGVVVVVAAVGVGVAAVVTKARASAVVLSTVISTGNFPTLSLSLEIEESQPNRCMHGSGISGD